MTSTMRFDRWQNSLGVDNLVVSSAGYINEPNKPIISGQVGSSGSFANQKIPFDDFWVQRGITYNSTTRRFTVPISGIYRITMNPFTQTNTGANRVKIGINDDSPTNANHRGMCYKSSSNHETMSLNSVVSLNANDYIVFVIEGTLYNATNDRFNQFTIEMIA